MNTKQDGKVTLKRWVGGPTENSHPKGGSLYVIPEQDAAFIVRACNAHGDLVEAGYELLNAMALRGRLDDHNWAPHIRKLRTALTKATKGE